MAQLRAEKKQESREAKSDQENVLKGHVVVSGHNALLAIVV